MMRAAYFSLIYSLVLVSIPMAAFSEEILLDGSTTISISEVTDQNRINEMVEDFQQQINRIGSGVVTDCNHVIDYVDRGMSRGGGSYGAICTIQNGNKSYTGMMCNDTMIGKFTFGGSDALSLQGVGRFIHNNCPPGG